VDNLRQHKERYGTRNAISEQVKYRKTRIENTRGDDNGFPWDVSPDGQRFLINQPTEQEAVRPPLTVLVN